MSNFDPFFQSYLRRELQRAIPQMVEDALEQLRREAPEKWLEVAHSLRKLGPYDRAEQISEAVEALNGVVEELAKLAKELIPEATKGFLVASERYFIQHGQDLDDLLRRQGPVKDITTKAAIEEMLRNMGIRSTNKDK